MAYDAQDVRFRGLTDLEVQDIAIEADIAEAVACRDVRQPIPAGETVVWNASLRQGHP